MYSIEFATTYEEFVAPSALAVKCVNQATLQDHFAGDGQIAQASQILLPYVNPDTLTDQTVSRTARRGADKKVQALFGAEHETALEDFLIEHGNEQTLELWREIAVTDYPAYLAASFKHFFPAAEYALDRRLQARLNPDSGAVAQHRTKPDPAVTCDFLGEFSFTTASADDSANFIELLANYDPRAKNELPAATTVMQLFVLGEMLGLPVGLKTLLSNAADSVSVELFKRKAVEARERGERSITEQIGFIATTFAMGEDEVFEKILQTDQALWPNAAKLQIATSVEATLRSAKHAYDLLTNDLSFFAETAASKQDVRSRAAVLLRKSIEEYVAMATPRITASNGRTAQVIQLVKADVSGFKAYLHGERRSAKRTRTTRRQAEAERVTIEEVEPEPRTLFVCAIQKSGEVTSTNAAPESVLEAFQKKYRGHTGALAAADRLMALLPTLDLSQIRRGIKQVDAGKNKGLKNSEGQEVKLYEIKPSEAGIGGGNLMRRIRFLFTLHPDGSIGLVDFIHRDSYSEWLANHGMGNN